MSMSAQRLIRLVQGDLYEVLSQLLRTSHNFEIHLLVERVSQDGILQERNQQVGKVKNWMMHKIHS